MNLLANLKGTDALSQTDYLTLEVRVQEETKIVSGLQQAFPVKDQDDSLKMALQGGAGSQDETPIFVVGLPRSGSTLVEQILASHPSVYGAGKPPVAELHSVATRQSEACSARTTNDLQRQQLFAPASQNKKGSPVVQQSLAFPHQGRLPLHAARVCALCFKPVLTWIVLRRSIVSALVNLELCI